MSGRYRLSGLALRAMILVVDAPADAPARLDEIAKAMHRPPSDLTKIMDRLVAMGWLTEEREEGDALDLGHLPYRWYRDTVAGRTRLGKAHLAQVIAAQTVVKRGPLPLLRSEIRERLEKSRRFWTADDGRASAGAVADEILKLLREHEVPVIDDDWQM